MTTSTVVWPLRKPRMIGANFAVSTGYMAVAGTDCYRVDPDYGVHVGWDLNGPPAGDGDLGYEVQAVYGGTVIYSQWCKVMGNVVVVRMTLTRPDQKPVTLYARYVHLRDRAVKVGATVAKGQLIGTVGKGDPRYGMLAHLHFDIWRLDFGKADKWNGPNKGAAALKFVRENYMPPLEFFSTFGITNISHEGKCPL